MMHYFCPNDYGHTWDDRKNNLTVTRICSVQVRRINIILTIEHSI